MAAGSQEIFHFGPGSFRDVLEDFFFQKVGVDHQAVVELGVDLGGMAYFGQEVGDAGIFIPELFGCAPAGEWEYEAVAQNGYDDPGYHVGEADAQHTAYAGPAEGAHEYGSSQGSDCGTGEGSGVIFKVEGQITGQHHDGRPACWRRNQCIESHSGDASYGGSCETFFRLGGDIVRIGQGYGSYGE